MPDPGGRLLVSSGLEDSVDISDVLASAARLVTLADTNSGTKFIILLNRCNLTAILTSGFHNVLRTCGTNYKPTQRRL
jgi:hypothetical protein